MISLEEEMQEVVRLLESGYVQEAETMVDNLVRRDISNLVILCEMPEGMLRHNISIFYNNIGANYYHIGTLALRRNDQEGAIKAAFDAERCHQKAIDLYNISLEDFMYFPDQHPIIKNVIFACWGLGRSKIALMKDQESKKYFEYAVKFGVSNKTDEQIQTWVRASFEWLRKLDHFSPTSSIPQQHNTSGVPGSSVWDKQISEYWRFFDQYKPKKVVVQATLVSPVIFNPQLCRITVIWLDWGLSPNKPPIDELPVLVTGEDVDKLEQQGLTTPASLEGHILELTPDESASNGRVFRIAHVHIQTSRL